MQRRELFEFEDQQWLPGIVRTGVTRLLVVLHRLFGTRDDMLRLIDLVRERRNFNLIVDLGSGSGGVMPEVVREMNARPGSAELQLLLTDLHPDERILAEYRKEEDGAITYHDRSVDATNTAALPDGLRTMVSSFHHLSRPVAAAVLRAAQHDRQPILIYELAENRIPFFLWLLLLPIGLTILFFMALVMTPFVRPISFRQLLLTYLVPVIPLVYAWDGQASLPRTYSKADATSLIADLDNEHYHWEIGAIDQFLTGRKQGFCLIGYPV
jgi:hypothetical protein